jgi:hypothetical protein
MPSVFESAQAGKPKVALERQTATRPVCPPEGGFLSRCGPSRFAGWHQDLSHDPGGIHMKKLVAIGAVALAAVFVAAPVVRAGIVDLLTFQSAADAAQAVDPTLNPPPNDGKHDFVVGGFRDYLGENIGLSAHSDPNGANPYGHESVTKPQDYKIRSNIVCLAVSGNLAAWGTVAKDGSEFVEVGRDGGPGGTGDGWNYVVDAAANCAAHVLDGALAPPLTSGNILIHDES